MRKDTHLTSDKMGKAKSRERGGCFDPGEAPQGLLVEGGRLSLTNRVIEGESESVGTLFGDLDGGDGISLLETSNYCLKFLKY